MTENYLIAVLVCDVCFKSRLCTSFGWSGLIWLFSHDYVATDSKCERDFKNCSYVTTFVCNLIKVAYT